MTDCDLEQVRTLHRAGRSREALLACRELLASEPNDVDALIVAGTLCLKLAEPRAAVDFFSHVLSLRPNFVPAHNNLGNAHYELRELEAAAASFQRALELAPDAAHLHRNLGTTLREQGKLDAALSRFQRALSLRPDWVRALQSLATTAMELGHWRVAAEACFIWLQLRPANVEALGLASIALDELGEQGPADELLDFDRLLQIRAISEPPPGFASLADFNAALAQHALEHPTLRALAPTDPRYHCPSLRLTAEFCTEAAGPAAALARLVAAAVDGYVSELARALPAHPFVAGAATRFALKSWATVLDGEGNLEPHVHYDSYVSAVYYPKIPSGMSSSQPGAGFLEFGGGPTRFPCRVRRPVRVIEPREGLLVLFPSYFYHRTAPFRAPEPRIAIAFDTVPAA